MEDCNYGMSQGSARASTVPKLVQIIQGHKHRRDTICCYGYGSGSCRSINVHFIYEN